MVQRTTEEASYPYLLIVSFGGKTLFRNFWFERSVFIFGHLVGIVAVGITLLRCW